MWLKCVERFDLPDRLECGRIYYAQKYEDSPAGLRMVIVELQDGTRLICYRHWFEIEE